ncbi:MAG: D-glycerate dehydrogenase [Ilumatobacter coccineus]|uniref:D-glycerate dehydrogenase n=1 Tax=Ilumatobacter coccineus TaxID=467094 RepID=A0A2G6KED4_9ACTN|nr:MAG: D-glycerate dehydrogenase [Ilumatobacter coccineus]
MSPRIVVTGKIPAAGLDILDQAGDLWAWDSEDQIPVDVRDQHLADADAVVTLLTDQVNDEFLDKAPKAKIIANVAVGYNNIDVAACERRGVIVTNTPGVLTDATADLTMSLLLMVTRRLAEGERLIRSQTPWQWGMFMMLGTGIQGRQLGIIGMGAIGRALARRAKAFGMTIVYHDQMPLDPDTEAELGARKVCMDELLSTSLVVSVNTPYLPETHHLIDADALAKMRSDAFVINSARGPIIDEEALVEALRSGQIAGAGLDVFENEPTVHPGLLELDNVVMLPHLGSATIDTRSAMAELAARNVVAVLAGQDPITGVSS